MNGRFHQQQFSAQNDWRQQHIQPINYSSYQPTHMQSTHITPYEYFAKPSQTIDWFQPHMESPLSEGNEQIDFDKLLTSIGQLASTYHQVSPIVKQIGSLVKLLR